MIGGDILEWITNLLNRLRGGKVKRNPQALLQDLKNIQSADINNFPEGEERQENQQNIFQPVESENNFPEGTINIKTPEDWQNIFNKLSDLQKFYDFINNFPLQWLKVRLGRVHDVLEKMHSPTDFDDEELNFNVAKKLRAVAEIMLEIYHNCIGSTELDDLTKKNLSNLVEQYLSSLCIEQKIFSAGDNFDDWANLAMQNSFTTQTTNDRELHNTIKNVEVQPRIIYYVNDALEVDEFIFGGLCTVFKFEEGNL